MVFPDTQVLDGRSQGGPKGHYTLPAGTHEYPWTFKVGSIHSCKLKYTDYE